MAATGDSKAALRTAILARRDALPAAQRVEWSARIFATIADLAVFRTARTVLAYSSFGSEPVTDPFLEAVVASGKTLALPRVDRATHSLELYAVTEPARQLRAGVWGIREPVPGLCTRLPPGEVEFALVPGVVFDVLGGRIGYGGGYYDRLLRTCPPATARVAGAFEVQVVDEVPMEPHDRRLDRVVTERRLYPSEPERP